MNTMLVRARRMSLALLVIAVIDQPEVVQKILRHLGLWNGGSGWVSARPPPSEWIREPCADVDPRPDYENVLSD